MPREPSTPRIAIWRRLKDHGIAQIGDGLVALPFSARTKEQLEWVAAKVLEADGEAIVWVAATTVADDASLVATMNEARDREYDDLIESVQDATKTAGANVDGRTVSRFRRELRRIERRDHFKSPRREPARTIVHTLARTSSADTEAAS